MFGVATKERVLAPPLMEVFALDEGGIGSSSLVGKGAVEGLPSSVFDGGGVILNERRLGDWISADWFESETGCCDDRES